MYSVKCKHVLHLNMVSDEAKKDEDTILPDLPDEISGEQLMMQQRVFRANKIFIKKHNDILNDTIHGSISIK